RHPRIADEAGGAADESERIVPGLLQAGGGQQLHEVAHVQARRRRVETDIIGQRLGVQCFLEGGLVGRNRDEAAGFEFAEYVGHFGPFETVCCVGAAPTRSILRGRRGGCARDLSTTGLGNRDIYVNHVHLRLRVRTQLRATVNAPASTTPPLNSYTTSSAVRSGTQETTPM